MRKPPDVGFPEWAFNLLRGLAKLFYRKFIVTINSSGKVAEWSKASDSKSFNRKLFVGSNPTLSVKDL